jgi:hypothetical protein
MIDKRDEEFSPETIFDAYDMSHMHVELDTALDRIVVEDDCGPELPIETRKYGCEIDILVPKLAGNKNTREEEQLEEHLLRKELLSRAKDNSNPIEQAKAVKALWNIFKLKLIDPKELLNANI